MKILKDNQDRILAVSVTVEEIAMRLQGRTFAPCWRLQIIAGLDLWVSAYGDKGSVYYKNTALFSEEEDEKALTFFRQRADAYAKRNK